VPKVEWSAVLFYTTEGVFGTKEFKCIGQELFLMDIGTAGYTEYEYGPDLIKHMMENKYLLPMSKGHIHSHNSMGVFFSGTDTEELHGNSEFHNLYLSLIVNNNNDMVAKIAFRAVQKAITLEYKDEKGQPKTETLQSEGQGYIFEYDCKISLPEIGDIGNYEERIKALKEKKREGGDTPQTGNFHNSLPAKKTLKGSEVEKDLYEFMTTLLDQDTKSCRMLSIILAEKSKEYENVGSKKMDKYFTALQSTALSMYKRAFLFDPKGVDFRSTLEDAILVLSGFEETYPDLVGELKDRFNIIKRHVPAKQTYGEDW
jgi:hypothetical protein